MPFKDWSDGLGRNLSADVHAPFGSTLFHRLSHWRTPPAGASGAESHAPDRSDVEVIPRDPDANRDDGDAMLHTGQATSWRVVAYFSREYEARAARDEAYHLGARAVALFPLDVNGDPVGPNG